MRGCFEQQSRPKPVRSQLPYSGGRKRLPEHEGVRTTPAPPIPLTLTTSSESRSHRSFGPVLPCASLNLPFFPGSTWQFSASANSVWKSRLPAEIWMLSECSTCVRTLISHCYFKRTVTVREAYWNGS